MPLFLRKFFDIREGETLRAFLMFAYIFLIIASLMIVKPVCNALFLDRFGVERLPYVFILAAVLAAAAARPYARLLKTVDLIDLIRRTLYAAIASLAVFWLLLHADFFNGGALFLFYGWIAVFALAASSQFWILANGLFNPREAKRLFGFIGAGAIAGGIFGGYLTKILAPHAGGLNLLWVCMLLLAAAIPIVRLLQHKTAREEALRTFRIEAGVREAAESPFRILRRSRHLAIVAALVGFGCIAGRLVEYQFSAIAARHIADPDKLAAFFGFWLSNLNIISFFIQLLATRRVVGVLGVGVSLMFLPLAILTGSVVLLIHPALWSAVLLKLCDGSLKNSVNKSGIELLALPVPSETKNQAKTFIDVFVDSFATGLSGLLLILAADGLGLSPRQMGIAIVPLVGAWLYVVFQARREYVRSFRLRLMKDNAWDKGPPAAMPASIFNGCVDILMNGQTDDILRVLQMLEGTRHDRLLPVLERLIDHESAAVRAEALKHAYFYPGGGFLDAAERRVRDADADVRIEAVHYLFQHLPEDRFTRIEQYLKDPAPRIRGAALLCAARESRRNHALKTRFGLCEIIKAELNAMNEGTDPAERRQRKITLARVIGAANIPEFHPYLYLFLNDEAPDVAAAAIHAMGETRQKRYLPTLIPMLAQSGLEKSAAEALEHFGPDIIDLLTAYIDNPLADRDIRLRLPHILSLMGAQRAADALARNLQQNDPALRYEIIKALNHLRIHFPSLKFDEGRVVRSVLEEARDHLDLLSILARQRAAESKKRGPDAAAARTGVSEARDRLIAALEKRLDENLERIFRLLGLKYPPDEIYDAYRSLRSERRDMRAAAVELLDNLLAPDLKRALIPLIEIEPAGAAAEGVLAGLGRKPPSEHESMAALLSGGDSVLQVLTLRLMARIKSESYVPLAAEMLASPDADVQEAARSALMAMGFRVQSPNSEMTPLRSLPSTLSPSE